MCPRCKDRGWYLELDPNPKMRYVCQHAFNVKITICPECHPIPPSGPAGKMYDLDDGEHPLSKVLHKLETLVDILSEPK
jgi:hypothetical protein